MKCADFSHVVEKNVFEGILIVDMNGIVIYVNDSATRLLNRNRAELINIQFGFPILSGEFIDVEIVKSNGDVLIVEMRATKIKHEGKKSWFVSLRDVTENMMLKEKLHDMAVNDELTNLLNRRGFFLLANQQFSHTKRLVHDVNIDMILFFMDIDGFKDINDTLGHLQGDRVLIDVANILTNTFRDSDIIGRMGGDEFVVLALDTPNIDIVYNRLHENINAYNDKNRAGIPLSLSVGVSRYNPETCFLIDELIKEADALMYEQKKKKTAHQHR